MTPQKRYFCYQIDLRNCPFKAVTSLWLITDRITHVSETLLLTYSLIGGCDEAQKRLHKWQQQERETQKSKGSLPSNENLSFGQERKKLPKQCVAGGGDPNAHIDFDIFGFWAKTTLKRLPKLRAGRGEGRVGGQFCQFPIIRMGVYFSEGVPLRGRAHIT